MQTIGIDVGLAVLAEVGCDHVSERPGAAAIRRGRAGGRAKKQALVPAIRLVNQTEARRGPEGCAGERMASVSELEIGRVLRIVESNRSTPYRYEQREAPPMRLQSRESCEIADYMDEAARG